MNKRIINSVIRLAIVFATLGMLTLPVMGGIAIVDIDNFESAFFTLEDTGTYIGYGSMIGGQRDTTFTESGNPTLNVCDGMGYWPNPTSGGGQAWWTLEYGLGSDDGLNLNLIGLLRDQITIVVDYKNIEAPVPLTVTVTSGKGTPNSVTSSVTKDITGVVTSGCPPFVVPFSEFGGVNFSDVDYLKFKFDATDRLLNGLGLVIGDIYFCPEPATIMMFGCGGLFLIRRKRQKSH